MAMKKTAAKAAQVGSQTKQNLTSAGVEALVAMLGTVDNRLARLVVYLETQGDQLRLVDQHLGQIYEVLVAQGGHLPEIAAMLKAGAEHLAGLHGGQKAMVDVFTTLVAKPPKAPRAPKEEKPAAPAQQSLEVTKEPAPVQAPAAPAAGGGLLDDDTPMAATAQNPIVAAKDPVVQDQGKLPITVEHLKTAFLTHVAKVQKAQQEAGSANPNAGREAGLALLGRYGAKLVSQVPPARWAEFLAEVSK